MVQVVRAVRTQDQQELVELPLMGYDAAAVKVVPLLFFPLGGS